MLSRDAVTGRPASAAVRHLRRRFAHSLSLPCSSQTPLALSLVFIFFYFFSFSPLTHKSSARSVIHACVPQTQLFPLHPWSPTVPPALYGHQLGCCPLFILHKCWSCHTVLAGDSLVLRAGVWAGTETPVLGANSTGTSAQHLCLPPCQEGLILSLRSPFSRSAGLCMNFWAGAASPRWVFSNPCPRTASLKSCCRWGWGRASLSVMGMLIRPGVQVLGAGKGYSGYVLSFPEPIRCWWPWPGSAKLPLSLWSSKRTACPALRIIAMGPEGHGPLDGPHGFSFPPPPPCPSAPAVVTALPSRGICTCAGSEQVANVPAVVGATARVSLVPLPQQGFNVLVLKGH